MKTKFVEVTNGFNWGKFMLGTFTDPEWLYEAQIMAPSGPTTSLLMARGWRPAIHMLVLDIETGEGAIFAPGGLASADLDKHKIWVCPMFEPFLEWLYEQFNNLPEDPLKRHAKAKSVTHLMEVVPACVELPQAESAMFGYRREGR